MVWVWRYIVVSLAVGVAWAFYETYVRYKEGYLAESSEQAAKKVIQEHIDAGNIQHEQYGDREVNYRKNLRGEVALKSAEEVNKIAREKPFLYLVMIFVVGFVLMTITWPVELFKLVLSFIRGEEK